MTINDVPMYSFFWLRGELCRRVEKGYQVWTYRQQIWTHAFPTGTEGLDKEIDVLASNFEVSYGKCI